MIVVTGRTSVGKTTIINKSGAEDVFYLDNVIKDVFYKRNFKLYWDIKNEFGKEYTNWRKVNTKKLGQLVFSDKKQLDKLNKIVSPYIHTYLNVLKETKVNCILEMAIYMNHEKEYKKYFDKVILIDREVQSDDKFKYLDKKIKPIKKTKIKYDVLINDESLDKAVESFKKAIK